jgi:mRNA interferase MazF
MEVKQREIVLCEFFFSDLKQYKMRPVVVFKTNLPFDDFVGIPISSQLTNLNDDEILIEQSDFIDGLLPKRSKVIVRKTFVISSRVIVKKYGTLSEACFNRLFRTFCTYFQCH